MKIHGIAHIELTVSDLSRSKEFYGKIPGMVVVAEYPSFIMFANGSFCLGLTDHKNNLQEKRFSEFNVGLDHLAFGVNSMDDLNEGLESLVREEIEHSDIKRLSNNSYIITFRDPDNIQREFAYKN